MKYLLLIFIQCSLVLRVSSTVDENFLSLTSADGKTVRAKVLSYDKSSDTVLIERENHKRYTVSPGIFCDADQSKTRKIGVFMSDSNMKVSIKHIEERINETEENTKQRMLDDVDPDEQDIQNYISMDYYKITLDNHTDHNLNEIKAEVIPFITTEDWSPHFGWDKKIKEPYPARVFDIGDLKASTSKEIETAKLGAEVIIIDVDSKLYAKNITELQGLWIRMTMKLADGTEVVREIKESESLWTDIAWSDATKSIDLKKKKR